MGGNSTVDNLVYRRRRLIDAAAITAHESGTDSVDLPRAQNTDIKALTTTGGTEIAPQNYLDALTAEGGTENIPQDYLDSLVIDGGTEVVSKTYIDSVTQEGVTEFVPETYIDSVTQEGAVEVVPESFLDTVTAEGATEQVAQTYTDEVVLTLFEMDEQSQRWVGSPGGRQAPGSADLLILKICPTFSTSKFLTWGNVIVPLILAYCRKF